LRATPAALPASSCKAAETIPPDPLPHSFEKARAWSPRASFGASEARESDA